MPAADRPSPLDAANGADGADSARAETVLPLTADEAFDFVCDVARLFRLNPLLAIEEWIPAEWGFRCRAHNESNDRPVDVGARIAIDPAARTLACHYDAGLKRCTRVTIEAAADGARLIVVEDYPLIADPADPRVAEVDRSLVPWVAALRRHLLARRRWGRIPALFPLWRWWNERFMLAMVPRNRRIVRLLLWISLLEFLVFLGSVAVLRLAS